MSKDAESTPQVAARQPLKPGQGGGAGKSEAPTVVNSGDTEEAARPGPSVEATSEDKAAEKKAAEKKAAPKKAAAKKSPAKKPRKTRAEKAAAATAAPTSILRLNYIEPWSVTRMAFVISVSLMIVSVVAVTVAWFVLQVTGVWGAFNDSVTNLLSDDAGSFDINDYVGFSRVVGITLILSALNVIFMTALATICAQLYNLAAKILGGIEVTFAARN